MLPRSHSVPVWRVIPLPGVVAILLAWTFALAVSLLFYRPGDLASGFLTYAALLTAVGLTAALWLTSARRRFRKAYYLTINNGWPVWWEVWMLAEDFFDLPDWALWTEKDAHIAVIDYRGEWPQPFSPWAGPESHISSEDAARALEQSAAETLFESKSKLVADTVKIGALTLLVGGGMVLVYLLFQPPKV